MSNEGKKQEAMLETAEQTKKLVAVISDHVFQLKIQHGDNVASQKYMLYANIIMTVATVVMALEALFGK